MKTPPQTGHMPRSAANFLEGSHLKRSGAENRSASWVFFRHDIAAVPNGCEDH